MSDTTLPTGGNTNPSTPPPAEPPVDNAAFARMRQALEAEKAKAATLEAEKADIAARLKTHEDASKTEMERLQEQAKEAERLRDENGKFTSATQKLYDDALAAIPEDKRTAVAALSASGNYAERLVALHTAAALMGGPPAPKNAGTNNVPAAGAQPGNVQPAPLPKTFEEIHKLRWDEALGAHPVRVPKGAQGVTPVTTEENG